MPVDFLQGWMKDRIEESLTEGRRGEYKPGFLESIGGSLVGVDAGQVADEVKTYDDNQEALEVLKGTGKSRTQLGLSTGDLTPEQVRGAYANYKETKADRDSDKAYDRQMAPLQMQMQQQMNLTQLQMADAKDARAAELQYQKMRDRRADQEYNERMERLDRKDRQAMMQNLAAGLASLGAAFAL